MDSITKEKLPTAINVKQISTPLELLKSVNNSQSKKNKIVVIASSKGGVGKSLIASSIGYYLSQQNKSVTLIDFNLASPGLHTFFNIKDQQNTFKQIIYQPDIDLNELTQETGIKDLKLICGCPDTLGMVENAGLIVARLIESANDLLSDFVIFDLGTGVNRFDTKLFLLAHTAILVGTPEPTTILENFSFLKLCILQRLEQIYKGQNKKLNIIKEAYSNFNTKVNEKIKALIKELNGKTEVRYYNEFLQFFPGYILNMVHDDSDYPYVQAIDIAIKEMFGLELKQMGTIPFCSQMRSQIKTNSIYDIFKNSNDAVSCYKNIAEKLLNKLGQGVVSNEPIRIKKITKIKNDFDQYNKHLICSSHCSLWENCAYQYGGYPCKIKYIGFINTN